MGQVDGIARFIDGDRVVVADCSWASACAPGSADELTCDPTCSQPAWEGPSAWAALGA